VAGQLFTPTVRTDVYEKLTMPTLIVYGDDPNVSFDKLPDLLRSNDNVSAVRLEQIRSLPHWDRLEATTDAINDLWNR
jgi:pimeloyl-ACP methyl ester carboxylesterase